MTIDAYTTSVMSARSGRHIAFIKLETPVVSLQVNQRLLFTIIKGFRTFLVKYLETHHFIIVGSNNQEYFIRIASFPTERTGRGYIDIDSPVPLTKV